MFTDPLSHQLSIVCMADAISAAAVFTSGTFHVIAEGLELQLGFFE
jgi:hypothetical protein